ncbi:adenylate/guanylate cyclase domain-containing protein, partial [Enterococcus casseliflavus]|uniref:adenylate/guanylate cyclase domain-containing protein n=1 Tax=Enterococcus casseliflavus TaxID=37734 RepID=UPI003D113633
ALRAVQSGLDMLTAMDRFNHYLERTYGKRLDVGVGIHYGDAVVGTVGAPGDMRITAIGDAVNFASRIESYNKDAQTRLLISQETYEHVKDKI